MHVLVNGLCVTPGGIFTVARELLASLAHLRPDWKFTLLLTSGRPLHCEFVDAGLPSNVEMLWAPAATANRGFRIAYENTVLPRWVQENKADVSLQINGMIIPALGIPTFSHSGDPWPYRADLWRTTPADRIVAFFKRHEHRRALRTADFIGWTSNYLRDLVCAHFGFEPLNHEVFHNGMPERYLEKARQPLPEWESRPMDILTVSTVVSYKRQALVIEALPSLIRRPGFENVRYRMIGLVSPRYRAQLQSRANELGVGDHIIFEGRVSQTRVEEAYANARVFAFPSVCECFGLPPVEAMVFGTPNVIADCCSAREIYGDAVEYCTPDDAASLADALARVMTDTDRAEELRRRGALCAQRYSWTKTAERVAGRLGQLVTAS